MGRVGLFIPCYVDQLYPEVGLATVRVLERHGVQAEYPRAQTCCGQPVANSGCAADAVPLAEKFLRIFGRFEHVVAPSGSCVAMVRNHYRELLGARPELEVLERSTYELCEYLVDVLHVAPKGRFAHKV